MADDNLVTKIHALSDLELAILLCLLGREHCLVSTPGDALEDLTQELQLVAKKTFGLGSVVVDCSPSTTLEDFAAALLVPKQHPPASATATATTTAQGRHGSYFVSEPAAASGSRHKPALSPLTPGSSVQIANLVLARNLDRAPQVVQIQALELLRTRRIFTRTSVQAAPRQFVFIPLLASESGGEARVTPHLNDFLYIAYWHDPDDGFVNLDEADGGDAVETASTGSVVKKSQDDDDESPASPLILESELSSLATLSQEVQVDIEITRYQMNIVSFLRMHRAVAGGMTPAATKHFGQLMRCLAPLHRLEYVTPALVDLAARKVYLHRIQITPPEKERSMQWGSKIEAAKALLEGVGPEDVIEDVLAMVAAPV